MSLTETSQLSEDPLTFLPHKPVQHFARGSDIYGGQDPAAHLYAVILGRVKITTTSDDGSRTIVAIVRAEGLFGESCLLASDTRPETATALDDAAVMAWTPAEVERQIEIAPGLGVALIQNVVRRRMNLQDRIESVALDKTPGRVMLAMMQLARDLGSPIGDGFTRLSSLTHQTIAEYVGTTREIVTSEMNRMRRLGMLRYSRKHIDINMHQLDEHLRRQRVSVVRSPGEAIH